MEVHAVLTEELTFEPAWNLTVQELHTYSVIAAGADVGARVTRGPPVADRADAVLVHNCSPSAGTGPVEFSPPPNASKAEVQEVVDYVASCERARCAGLTSGGRVSTSGALRRQASAAAAAERRRAAAAGTPYSGVVGHGPDTTWTGLAKPPEWMDISGRVNSSLGGQSLRYPVGYIPTEFVFVP
jgi:hypothetical protein